MAAACFFDILLIFCRTASVLSKVENNLYRGRMHGILLPKIWLFPARFCCFFFIWIVMRLKHMLIGYFNSYLWYLTISFAFSLVNHKSNLSSKIYLLLSCL